MKKDEFLKQTNDPTSRLNKFVARKVHDDGFELTPQQVIEERQAAYAEIRAALRENGIEPPEDDGELAELIADALKKG